MNWPIAKINDVANVVSGGTPKSSVPEYWGGDIEWITPKDMGGKQNEIFVSSTDRTISRAGLDKSSAKLIPENSVILSTRAPIGHLVINIVPMAFNQGCRGLVPTGKIDVKFLYYFLYANVDLLNDLGTGATFKELSKKALEEIELPLPSLPEQKRIVAILDQTFADIDKARALTEQNLKNARELFESYLQQVFSQRGEGWAQTTLGCLCEKMEYGTSEKSSIHGKTPVLRMGNIQNGELEWESLVYTDNKEDTEKLLLKDGDVLFNRTNSPELVGKSAIFRGNRPAIFAGYLIRVHMKKELLDPDYLNFYLNSATTRKYGFTVMSHSTNQANISGSKLKAYPISLPSIEEQQKISFRFRALKKEVKKIEKIYNQKLESLDQLRKSLLQKAFSGELGKDNEEAA